MDSPLPDDVLEQVAGEPGLAGARRAMQQHPAWRINAKPGEELRIAQRQFNHFTELIDRFMQPADIVIGDIRAAMLGGFFIFRPQFNLCLLEVARFVCTAIGKR